MKKINRRLIKRINKQEQFKQQLQQELDIIEPIAKTGDIQAMFLYCNKILESTFLSDYEKEEYLFKTAEYNYYSMLYLARIWKQEGFLTYSKQDYIVLLKKIRNADLSQRLICYLEQEDDNIIDGDHDHCEYPEELQDDFFDTFKYIVGEACFELGQIFRSSESLDELEDAEEYYLDARTCEYPPYPGPYVTEEIIIDLGLQIEKIKNRLPSQDLFKDVELTSGNMDKLVLSLKEKAISFIGEESWNLFHDQTQKCIITAMVCYCELFKTTSETRNSIDFASVIIPLMKALEYELRIRFYNGYIEYLKNKKRYTTDDFFSNNNRPSTLKALDKYRGGIFYQPRGTNKLEYSDYVNHPDIFTLGKYSYVLGKLNTWTTAASYACDLTMIEYCIDELHFINDKDLVDKWLFSLATDIDVLSDRRNNAAHGGSVVDIMTADQTFDDLIAIEKILAKVVTGCIQ